MVRLPKRRRILKSPLLAATSSATLRWPGKRSSKARNATAIRSPAGTAHRSSGWAGWSKICTTSRPCLTPKKSFSGSASKVRPDQNAAWLFQSTKATPSTFSRATMRAATAKRALVPVRESAARAATRAAARSTCLRQAPNRSRSSRSAVAKLSSGPGAAPVAIAQKSSAPSATAAAANPNQFRSKRRMGITYPAS